MQCPSLLEAAPVTRCALFLKIVVSSSFLIVCTVADLLIPLGAAGPVYLQLYLLDLKCSSTHILNFVSLYCFIFLFALFAQGNAPLPVYSEVRHWPRYGAWDMGFMNPRSQWETQ